MLSEVETRGDSVGINNLYIVISIIFTSRYHDINNLGVNNLYIVISWYQ